MIVLRFTVHINFAPRINLYFRAFFLLLLSAWLLPVFGSSNCTTAAGTFQSHPTTSMNDSITMTPKVSEMKLSEDGSGDVQFKAGSPTEEDKAAGRSRCESHPAVMDWSNDTDPPKDWNLPMGAAQIIEQMAAEELLHQLLQPLPPSHTKKAFLLEQSQSRNNETPYPRADLAAIKQLVERYPAICARSYELPWEDGDVRQLYPLAKLVLLKPTLSLLTRVYQAYPPALTEAEPTKGCIPLHYACSSEGSLDVVQFLHQQHPPSIRQARKDGMWPLHLACYFRAPLPIVQYVYQHAPQAMEATDQEDWSPLHAAARGHATLAVMEYIYQQHCMRHASRAGGRPAAAAAAEDILQSGDDHGRTPLHLACMKQGGAPVVEFLVRQSPPVLEMEDAHSLTPLFHAAKSQNADTLRHLLCVMHELEQQQQQQEEGDNEPLTPTPLPNPPRDPFGSTLLHFAVAANNDAAVVDFLCQQYPDMIHQRSAHDMAYSALHVACLCNGPLANIQRLVHHFPRCLFFTTGQGHYAWDIAKRCVNVQPELVLFLEAAMDDPKIQQAAGWNPLCEN